MIDDGDCGHGGPRGVGGDLRRSNASRQKMVIASATGNARI
jgi:hypothetical protein